MGEHGEDISPLNVGDLVDGRFRVRSMIGMGGMGAVYAAENERTGRVVALKVVVKSAPLGDDALSRFRQEAIACGRVRHLNVVDVYDSGVCDEMPYMVMELLEGESLAARADRQPLSPDEALTVMRQAADGLAAAHDAGIIHRDLKPDNLFLADVAGHDGPVTKVLDFGIAKLSAQAGSLVQTASTVIFGTPHYMSPEQARGAKHVDVRTDVYSLGATIFESLTGRSPFAGDNYNAVIVAILTSPTPALRLVRPSAPAGLEALLTCAMARDPDDRFQSMAELMDAIDRVRERPDRADLMTPNVSATRRSRVGDDVEVPPTALSLPPASPRHPRRWPFVLGAAAIGATLVVGSWAALADLGRPNGVAAPAEAGVEPVPVAETPPPTNEPAVAEQNPGDAMRDEVGARPAMGAPVSPPPEPPALTRRVHGRVGGPRGTMASATMASATMVPATMEPGTIQPGTMAEPTHPEPSEMRANQPPDTPSPENPEHRFVL